MSRLFPKGKILIFVVTSSILISSLPQSATVISPKFSLDISGKHEVTMADASGELNVNTGISISIEILTNIEKNFNFGGGIMYLFPREQEVYGSGNFNFIPIYATAKVDLARGVPVVPSLVGSIGYNVLFNGDSNYKGPMNLRGGIYLSGGIRISPGILFFEALFKSFGGSASYQNIKIDISYTTFSIGAGVML